MKLLCPGNVISTTCPVLQKIQRTFAMIAQKSSFTAIIQYTFGMHCIFAVWHEFCQFYPYGVFSGPYISILGPNAGKHGPEKTPCWTLFAQ